MLPATDPVSGWGLAALGEELCGHHPWLSGQQLARSERKAPKLNRPLRWALQSGASMQLLLTSSSASGLAVRGSGCGSQGSRHTPSLWARVWAPPCLSALLLSASQPSWPP